MHSSEEQLKIIEQNHFGHFTWLPKNLGFEVHEINGVTVINCGLQTSMFNIAYGSPNTLDGNIHEIKQAFREQAFAWWIPQTRSNPELTQILGANGFIRDAAEHAMFCDIKNVSNFVQKTDLVINYVTNSSLLQDFISVLETYDPHVSAFYGRINDELLNANEKLAVGYADGQPVTIGILYDDLFVDTRLLPQNIFGYSCVSSCRVSRKSHAIKQFGKSSSSAGIFSLITRKDSQKKGYGTDMMAFLMKMAKDHGCHSVTLSASSDSGYRIYERLGFLKVGAFECFECKDNQA